jgi:hypothetical protein
LLFFLLTVSVRWSNPTRSLSPVLTMDGGVGRGAESHETGMPGLIDKVPSQGTDQKGTVPICCCCLSRWDLSLLVFWPVY